MKFPINLHTVNKIKEIMEKKPDVDFMLDVSQANGILSKIDLVYMKHDEALGISTAIHITVDE